jgi:outer membrane protein with beta-barrel domain
MRRTTVLLVQVLAVGVSLLGPSRVSGEPFLDLYGGVAETESASVTAQRRDCSGDFVFGFSCSPWTKAARRVDFDTAATFGGRAGYWFERAPWVGVAGDLSFFEAKGRDARFTIVPLSFLLMLRLPLLTTEDIPKGRLQPYVGVGPSVFHQDASVDFRPQVGKKVEIGSTAVGLDARVGLAWQVHRRVALFTEYRFTYLPISTDDESETFGIVSPAIERLDATLNTHHLLVGVSFRF